MKKENKSIVIDQDLRKAYELADYKLFDPEILFKIGQKNGDLKLLIGKHKVAMAFFISAFNPNSIVLEKTVNDRRHHSLKDKLRSLNCIIHEGIGEDANGKWPGELSFLVIGIPKTTIIDIARFFEQLAIVEIDKEGNSNLLWC